MPDMRESYYHSPSDQVYHLAMRKYPVRWWENPRSRLLIAVLLIYPLLLVQSSLGDEIWISIVAVAITLASFAADTYSSILIMRLKPEFDRRGLEFRTHEVNRFLPMYPTARELVFHRMNLFAIGLVVLTFLLPVSAVFAILVEGVQALGNFRTWERLKLALVIASQGSVDRDAILT